MGYRDLMEKKRGQVLREISDDAEFSIPVTQQANTTVHDAVYLFDTVCREYEFRRDAPRWKKLLKGQEHKWGSSIFGHILQGAGLVEVKEGRYVPSAKGLEIYNRHKNCTP